ncbi:ARP9 [Candida oxycetoniae]|uniref:ARP9 n=1 Tax=Candida oxycetoniae TaxID=497107 RepID=A0AAI9SVZ3_9ASCO|nr:ARP9 [Candida oxycetoniae]KAI3403962.2 ARP9 [Candida oxycetoniae]
MPLYKENHFLIIYPGSDHMLFSFGIKDSLSPPQFRIPSIVYQNSTTKEYLSSSADNCLPIQPIQDSKITDLDAFNALLQIILSSIIKQHPVTINQIPVLIIVPSLTWSKRQIEYITKFVFEKLEITAFNILDLSLASIFGIGGGTVNATVVHVGDNNIQVAPVIGYQTIKYAGVYIKGVGGKVLDEEIKEKRPDLSESQIDDLKYSGIFEFLQEGEESIQVQNDTNEDEGEFDVAKIVANDDGNEDPDVTSKIRKNKELEKNFFIDSNTQERVVVGKERFFTSSKLIGTISSAIFDSLLKINDLDKRQDCYDNIILVGSVFQIPGLKQKIIAKLITEYLVTEPPTETNGVSDPIVNPAIIKYQQLNEPNLDDGAGSTLSQVPNSIRLAKLPDYFPEWKKPKTLGGSWQDLYFLGGEIYAKQIFSGGSHHHNKELFVASDMYEERGPQSIWDVSI